MKKMSNKQLALVLGSILLVGALIITTMIILQHQRDSDNQKEEEAKIIQKGDITGVATPEQVEQISQQVVKKIYGKTYTDLYPDGSPDNVVLPNSGVTFSNYYVANERELAILSILAYKQNWALSEEDTKTTLDFADGQEVDLKLQKMDYTGMQIYGYSDDPAFFRVEGYCNGIFFNENVDMLKDWID